VIVTILSLPEIVDEYVKPTPIVIFKAELNFKITTPDPPEPPVTLVLPPPPPPPVFVLPALPLV
jgi:hypothetical protein